MENSLALRGKGEWYLKNDLSKYTYFLGFIATTITTENAFRYALEDLTDDKSAPDAKGLQATMS